MTGFLTLILTVAFGYVAYLLGTEASGLTLSVHTVCTWILAAVFGWQALVGALTLLFTLDS